MSLLDWWKKASSLVPKSSSSNRSTGGAPSSSALTPNTSTQSSVVDTASPKPRQPTTTQNLLVQVFRYYYRQYKPTDQTLTRWKSGSIKYIIKPGSILAIGVVGVWLSDVVYRKLKVEKEAPSIFGKQEKITPHTLIYETDWLLTDSMIIDEEDEKQRKRNRNVIREYFFGSKKEEQTPINLNEQQHGHILKKFYAKWDYYPNVDIHLQQQQERPVGDRDKIIHHVHIEKFHPYSNIQNGYWSTLLEYAIIHNAVENGSVSLRLVKEQRETFASYVWRKLFTNREFETWRNTKYWLHKPWNLNEIHLDLQQDAEVTIHNLKDYLENNISDASVKQVILATMNSENNLNLSPEFLKENYYLYVSDEAFNEFKKMDTTNSTIRVTERSAKIGDALFCVGTRSQNPSSDLIPDVSGIRFVTHKPEPKYIEDFVQQEKKNHSPIWWRAFVITGSLGFAIASIIG
ncbi:hypothetical protein C9374_010126 [Naegleria lovaniensis]|uniref:Uncharacterized protein n=1 Tax=Naegleria lovaniensis TaxID=51637 RepID=A0AA88GCL4_NAELO|nr:uncharacterized protein C9374_010126 [Naegleria lovaniensis]KAG2375122.1 hypothetical protein C9374_010126 [Naegleria lovaniensis]